MISKKYGDQKSPILEGDGPKDCQGSESSWQLIM